MPQPREFMIIFGVGHSAASRGYYRVTQKMSPRVVIVEAAGDVKKEELQTMAGVVAVLEPGEPAPRVVSETLTETEALFVNAYAQRSQHKVRPGQGLDWDTKGFLPPDLPHKD